MDVTFRARLLAFVACTFLFSSCGARGFRKFGDEILETDATSLNTGKKLAAEHCSRCHLVPSPESMTQDTANFVMTYMGLFMGIDSKSTLKDPLEMKQFDSRQKLLKIGKMIAASPELDRPSWYTLRNYYLVNARSPYEHNPKSQRLDTSAAPFRFEDSAVTLLANLSDGSIAIGGGLANKLQILDSENQLVLEAVFSSPPVWVQKTKSGYYVLTLGDLLGSISGMENSELWLLAQKSRKRLLHSLPRSSHFVVTDFNGDGVDDFLISAFGTLGNGKFVLFESNAAGYSERIVANYDSVVRSHIWGKTGKNTFEIMALRAGAREQLLLFTISPEKITERILTEYPPHLGSVWLDASDILGTGERLVLVLSGDNADCGPYPPTKPDQGLRMYSFSGGVLREKGFVSLPGALALDVSTNEKTGTKDLVVTHFYSPVTARQDLSILRPSRSDILAFAHESFTLESRPTIAVVRKNKGKRQVWVGTANFPMVQKIENKPVARHFSGKPVLIADFPEQ